MVGMLAFQHVIKYLRQKTYRKRFILAHGFNPWSVDPVDFEVVVRSYITMRARGRKMCSPHGTTKE